MPHISLGRVTWLSPLPQGESATPNYSLKRARSGPYTLAISSSSLSRQPLRSPPLPFCSASIRFSSAFAGRRPSATPLKDVAQGAARRTLPHIRLVTNTRNVTRLSSGPVRHAARRILTDSLIACGVRGMVGGRGFAMRCQSPSRSRGGARTSFRGRSGQKSVRAFAACGGLGIGRKWGLCCAMHRSRVGSLRRGRRGSQPSAFTAAMRA